jgi:hypothetical protein
LGWLSSLALPARLVGVDGARHRTPGWPDDDQGRLEPRDPTR